jgi:DNA invertase Pin-like site-specific DNA recombinase
MESVSNSGTRVGYTRVSTVAQTLDQQNTALAAADVVKNFSDTMFGAKDDRPGLAALMEYVRDGDTVVIWKLDRLGRNTLHILETVKALTDAGVTLISTTDGIDSSTRSARRCCESPTTGRGCSRPQWPRVARPTSRSRRSLRTI